MDTTISTNILFSTVSIFLILITLGSVFLMIYTMLIFKSIRSFLRVIKKESEKIADDVAGVRAKIKGGEAIIASFVSYIVSLLKDNRKKSK